MNKSQFVKKVFCPDHDERTPSCAVYADGSGYCFSCSKYFKELGEVTDATVKPVEDIESKITYIKGLPITPHRSLLFPSDAIGYYIVWPDSTYYKCRRWLPDNAGSKYLNPSGVSQPWFNLLRANSKTLVIIEGEINALSLYQVTNNLSVCCPGSAGQFNLKKSSLSLQLLAKYDRILLIADKDSAGAQAVIKLKKELLSYNPDVAVKLVKEDYNTILVNYGTKTLKEEIGNLDV